VTRFIILATPRTGSNWLCTLLDSHPQILCHHEIFNPEGIHVAYSVRGRKHDLGTVAERDRNPLAALERVWRWDLGHATVGFKINRGQSDTVLRRVLEDRSVRKIVIRRSNRVRTFVSELIAERTGEWESYPGLAIGLNKVKVRVDPGALAEHSRLNQRYYADAARMLRATGQTALEVLYEELGDQRTQRAVLRFLGVSSDVALRGATRRQNPAPLAALIEDFDALKTELRGSEFEHDLAGDAAGADPMEQVNVRVQGL
jgi:LPS sulfotransferase NodH